ncbi:hypothetical protein [Microbacterium sp. TPU 3598]|nr:hypothetical protein [Microbacterium sp. TPU 3598]
MAQNIRLTEEQARARQQVREARLNRSVTDVARDIKREQQEYNRLLIASAARS